MKTRLLLAFAFAAGAAACSDPAPDAFTFRGEIAGMDGEKIYLMYDGSGGGKKVLDSAVVKRGRFAFEGKIAPVSYSFLMKTRDLERANQEEMSVLWLEPGKMAYACPTGDLQEFTLTGSRTQDEQAGLDRQKASVMKELRPLTEAYYAAKDEAEREALNAKMAPLRAQAAGIEREFIASHPDSYITLQLMLFHVMDMDYEEARSIYDGLTDRVKASPWAAEVLKDIESLRLGVSGTEAYPFETTDIDGKPFRLADLRGKVVLLDFWASWCAPCRASNPHLKELYAKYKDKGFEIVCIADDDSNPAAWHKAVEQDGIGAFRHVLRGFKQSGGVRDNGADISGRYGIHFLPTKILVGKDGMIVGRYSSGDEEQLDAKLAELFGE